MHLLWSTFLSFRSALARETFSLKRSYALSVKNISKLDRLSTHIRKVHPGSIVSLISKHSERHEKLWLKWFQTSCHAKHSEKDFYTKQASGMITFISALILRLGPPQIVIIVLHFSFSGERSLLPIRFELLVLSSWFLQSSREMIPDYYDFRLSMYFYFLNIGIQTVSPGWKQNRHFNITSWDW